VEALRVVACGDETSAWGPQERGLTFVIRMCRLSHPSHLHICKTHGARGEARSCSQCALQRSADMGQGYGWSAARGNGRVIVLFATTL
jgi:hypothetical protein